MVQCTEYIVSPQMHAALAYDPTLCYYRVGYPACWSERGRRLILDRRIKNCVSDDASNAVLKSAQLSASGTAHMPVADTQHLPSEQSVTSCCRVDTTCRRDLIEEFVQKARIGWHSAFPIAQYFYIISIDLKCFKFLFQQARCFCVSDLRVSGIPQDHQAFEVLAMGEFCLQFRLRAVRA